jgi:hypothetical protein
VGLVGSCESGPTEPRPGALDLVFAPPAPGTGALLFVVDGAPIDSVEPAGYGTISGRLSASAVRVIVTGPLVPGPVARLRVPDVRLARQYRATLEEVADGATYGLRDTAGYRLAVAVPR